MAKDISFIEIITGDNLTRLDSIFRFSGSPILKPETISQHSWWVSLFTRLLLDKLFYKEEIDPLEYYKFCTESLSYSIGHDMSESASGDIIYIVKYSNINGDKIRKELDYFAEHKMALDFGENSLIRKYSLDPEDKCMKSITKISDWLSLLKSLVLEFSLGNRNLEIVFNTTFVQLEKQIDSCATNLIERFGVAAVNFDFINGLKMELNEYSVSRTRK